LQSIVAARRQARDAPGRRIKPTPATQRRRAMALIGGHIAARIVKILAAFAIGKRRAISL